MIEQGVLNMHLKSGPFVLCSSNYRKTTTVLIRIQKKPHTKKIKIKNLKKRQQKYAKGPYYELRFMIVELQFY